MSTLRLDDGVFVGFDGESSGMHEAKLDIFPGIDGISISIESQDVSVGNRCDVLVTNLDEIDALRHYCEMVLEHARTK